MHKRLILVCDDADLRLTLCTRFASSRFEVTHLAEREVSAELHGRRDTIAFVFASATASSCWTHLKAAVDLRPLTRGCPIFFLMGDSSEELILAALRARVDDVFRYPQAIADLTATLLRCLFVTESTSDGNNGSIVGNSDCTRRLKSYLAKVAGTNSNVLVTGETGTGKELAVAMLHSASARRNKPLIPVNCAAIPQTLVESELFGHERGAFTGAHTTQQGKFQMAEGGTIFLDEIGEMDFVSQAKLLRVIESRQLYRMGSKAAIPIDVRIMAATNQDPEQMVRENRFRTDLYFRLNVARVHLEPLRNRKEDIRSLVELSIRDLNRSFGREVAGCATDAWALLENYDWPGNVRELKNLMEATFIDLESNLISVADFPETFRQRIALNGNHVDERQHLLDVLSATNWNKSKAAESLKWSRMTLYRKMARYNVSVSSTDV